MPTQETTRSRNSPVLTEDMKRLIREQPLGYVATIAPDGGPAVSPKATFVVMGDTTIAYGDVRSPGTSRNLRANPRVEVNFVDPFVRKGYRLSGTATVTARGDSGFDELYAHFQESTLAPRMHVIVTIEVTRALPVVSPIYDDGRTEAEVRRGWTARFRKLQPSERFTE